MHYKNGRVAQNGDKVVLFPAYPKGANGKSTGIPVVGILYEASAGNDFCNGKIAVTSPTDLCPNLAQCLHVDDILAALSADVPDSSKPASE